MSQTIKKQLHLNPYDYHKYLINEYVLKKPGDTAKLAERDTSKYKTDNDVIYENMRFIWNEDEVPTTWEERLAKKYFEKLYREYAICDLSKYKENKIANRFRIEKEVVAGKGQFICGEKSCSEQGSGLRTWEVNFAYIEAAQKKNALVKLRLCPACSEKINYHSKKREVKRLKRSSSKRSKSFSKVGTVEESSDCLSKESTVIPGSSKESDVDEERKERLDRPHHVIQKPLEDENLWKKSNDVDVKGRDEEFDDYLADLLL